MVGTKQSFRSVRRQRITEKTICKVANGGGGANIKESEASRAPDLGRKNERESLVVNGCNTKGHATSAAALRDRFAYCLKRHCQYDANIIRPATRNGSRAERSGGAVLGVDRACARARHRSDRRIDDDGFIQFVRRCETTNDGANTTWR